MQSPAHRRGVRPQHSLGGVRGGPSGQCAGLGSPEGCPQWPSQQQQAGPPAGGKPDPAGSCGRPALSGAGSEGKWVAKAGLIPVSVRPGLSAHPQPCHVFLEVTSSHALSEPGATYRGHMGRRDPGHRRLPRLYRHTAFGALLLSPQASGTPPCTTHHGPLAPPGGQRWWLPT